MRGAPDEQQGRRELVRGVGRGRDERQVPRKLAQIAGQIRPEPACVRALHGLLEGVDLLHGRAELRLQAFPGLFEGVQRSRGRGLGRLHPGQHRSRHLLESRPRGRRARGEPFPRREARGFRDDELVQLKRRKGRSPASGLLQLTDRKDAVERAERIHKRGKIRSGHDEHQRGAPLRRVPRQAGRDAPGGKGGKGVLRGEPRIVAFPVPDALLPRMDAQNGHAASHKPGEPPAQLVGHARQRGYVRDGVRDFLSKLRQLPRPGLYVRDKPLNGGHQGIPDPAQGIGRGKINGVPCVKHLHALKFLDEAQRIVRGHRADRLCRDRMAVPAVRERVVMGLGRHRVGVPGIGYPMRVLA